jgi:hypothetical protein
MSKASRRRQRWASDAAMQALVRYGPEQSGLKALERQAKSTYQTAVKTSRGSAQTIIGEVDRARPEVKHNYDKAGLDAARAAHAISDPVIRDLGPAAGTLKAAAMLERSGLQGRLAEGRATALTDLSQRRVQAVQGAQFAQSSARDTLVSELQKVFERSQDLRRESGAFQAATVGQLRDAAADRAAQFRIESMGNKSAERRARQQSRQQERNSKRTAGIDPDTGKPIKGGVLDPKSPRYKNKGGKTTNGNTPWSETEQRKAQDAIEKALVYVKQGDPGKGDKAARRAAIGRTLVQGVPGSTDPLTGKVTGGVPALPQAYVAAALDLHFDKALGRKTVKRLHSRGVKIKPLGYATHTKPRQYRPSRPPLAPGARGQQRPT